MKAGCVLTLQQSQACSAQPLLLNALQPQALVEAGADLAARDDDGTDAVETAQLRGHAACVQVMCR